MCFIFANNVDIRHPCSHLSHAQLIYQFKQSKATKMNIFKTIYSEVLVFLERTREPHTYYNCT